ncbi:dihydrolipoyl dehydrogenase [Alkalibacillus silvisoli]|uniref:Dihydrolipoyl dehydrogenase n=1 Tax=Alkalibacillus silvisoli TaxID=392823 RepID=A0ABN1A2F9_9BACI
MVVGEITQERDLMIIGGGPGGYNAAIRAAQLGLNVTLVEQGELGGVCLNEGCIPSKVWTYAAKKQAELPHMKELGIDIESPSINLERLLNYKSQVTSQLQQGVQSLLKKNQIEVIHGTATFTGDYRIGVEKGHQFDHYIFNNAIIATGSRIIQPDYFPANSTRAFVSEEIFQLNEIPNHIIIIGFDYLALELVSTYQSFGSKVTLIIEDHEQLSIDQSIQKEIIRLFKKKKVHILKQSTIRLVEETKESITAYVKKGKEEQAITGSHLLVSGQRKPNVDSLGLDRLGVKQTVEGRILVNYKMESTVPSIYAVGDVTEGESLAVKAIKQGKVAAESIANENPEVDLTFLPLVAHTNPPIASVGLTEQEVKMHNIAYQVGQFNLGGNGYSLISGKKDGLIKVISDANTDIILGVHMVGEGAVELSSHFVQLLEMAAKIEDVTFPHFAHPSVNEGLLEAIEALMGQSIHTTPKQQSQVTT